MTCSPRPCSIDGCERLVAGYELCSAHYRRFKRYGSPTGGRIPDGETARYFLEHVNVQTDECILWPYATSEGYGCVTLNGRVERAHVLACEVAHGPRRGQLDAAHACGVRSCFNPRHLRWATRAENIADRWRAA